MTCEECFADTRVIDSRKTNDVVCRRRKCRACGHKFSSFEMTEKAIKHLVAQDMRLRTLQETLADSMGVSFKKPLNVNAKMLLKSKS